MGDSLPVHQLATLEDSTTTIKSIIYIYSMYMIHILHVQYIINIYIYLYDMYIYIIYMDPFISEHGIPTGAPNRFTNENPHRQVSTL